jgi:hypothetical protein
MQLRPRLLIHLPRRVPKTLPRVLERHDEAPGSSGVICLQRL